MNCKTLQLSSSVMSLGYKSKWDSSSFYCNHNILSMCSLFLFQTPISPGVNSNFCFKSYKYEFGKILMIWTQANCAGINRVCLRQNCEHTRVRVVFLFFRTDHMICSAQCRAERGVDLLQIRNSAVKSWGISQPSSGLRALWSPYSKSPKCRVARPRGSLLTTRVAPCPGNFHLSKIIFHSFSLKVFFPLGKLADGAFYSSNWHGSYCFSHQTGVGIFRVTKVENGGSRVFFARFLKIWDSPLGSFMMYLEPVQAKLPSIIPCSTKSLTLLSRV